MRRMQAVRLVSCVERARWQGIIMLAFGAVGLYAILTSDGTPAEFIGV